EPEQRLGRDMLADRRLQLGRDRRHDPDLDKVEIPQQADPQDARPDVDPAEHRLPHPRIAPVAARDLDEGEDHHRRQHQAQQHGVAETRKQPSHPDPSPESGATLNRRPRFAKAKAEAQGWLAIPSLTGLASSSLEPRLTPQISRTGAQT